MRYPYNLQYNQEQKPPDLSSHQDFAKLVFSKIVEQHNRLHTVVWTEKAHFKLSDAVTTHNCKS